MALDTLKLDGEWRVHSSREVGEDGNAISRIDYDDSSWYRAKVPATIVDVLVQNRVYSDIYFSDNLKRLPGMTYEVGTNFSKQEMKPESPFACGWWYRAKFVLPAFFKNRRTRLIVKGINYRADLWINGSKVLSREEMAGTFRRFSIDITDYVRSGTSNVMAFEVFPPTTRDLAITWADWNPSPPDKDAGIWQDVLIEGTLDVSMEHPVVHTGFEGERPEYAEIKIRVDISNAADSSTRGQIAGTISGDRVVATFVKDVEVKGKSTMIFQIGDGEGEEIGITEPKLWWPYQMGDPYLYRLDLRFICEDGRISDNLTVSFGVSRVESRLNSDGSLLLHINGRPFLVRGGGWTPDLMLRRDQERRKIEFEYVRDLGLNTIRLEGKLDDDEFFDLADRYGVAVIAGWCCADAWEKWDIWGKENYSVSRESLRDQIFRFINHPSVILWMNGSDFHPPEDIERMYLEVEKDIGWKRPVLSSATAKPSELTGPTRVKMPGPYDYVPPNYWYVATDIGGASGFNTETGPGAAIPPVDDLTTFIPEDKLWPINDVWNFHSGLQEFKRLDRFIDAMNKRYGPAGDLADFVWKAELMAYEGERAMFEAYTRNRYSSTGVIHWMLNNAWPGLIWHLYTYSLLQPAGYFGAKKALEPVHVLYSYDDSSVVASNLTFGVLKDVSVEATVYGPDLEILHTDIKTLTLPADSVVRAFTLPKMDAGLYFVKASLCDASGRIISDNFYWLSSQEDVLDKSKTTFFYTPLTRWANFAGLGELGKPELQVRKRVASVGGRRMLCAAVSNVGRNISLLTRLRLIDRDTAGNVIPAFFSDNYFTLLPGESREIVIEIPRVKADGVDIDLTAFNLRK